MGIGFLSEMFESSLMRCTLLYRVSIFCTTHEDTKRNTGREVLRYGTLGIYFMCGIKIFYSAYQYLLCFVSLSLNALRSIMGSG